MAAPADDLHFTTWSDDDERRLAQLLYANHGGERLDGFIRRVSPRHPPPRHISPIIDLWDRTRTQRVFACVELPPRHAKLVADSTPILTPDGWRQHGDLVVGDSVYAPDGTATFVKHVTSKQMATLCVRFSDGESIKVNPGHRWTVHDRKRHSDRVMETGEIVAAGLHYDRKRNGMPRGRFLVETTRPVVGSTEIELPLDPYIFGLWLGDGSTGNGRITGTADDVAHHKQEALARGFTLGATNVHGTTGVVTFCVLGMSIRGLVGMTKFVPDIYFRADEERRRELLRGLIDSDGCVDRTGRCRFINANRRLVDDVARLVSSLGYRVTIEYRPPRSKPGTIISKLDVWCVSWTPTDGAQPARLPRKDIRHRAIARKRSIVAIVPCEPERGHCIEVDHASHCYLVGDRCVPTHNTTTGLHGLAYRMARDPALTHGFATFGDDFAASRSRIARSLARTAGVQLDKSMANLHEWRTTHGGGLIARGYMGEWTGKGIDGVALIDDPFKDRLTAESKKIRENVWEWFCDVLWTRLEPGSSVIVQHTRWHDDDLIGRLLDGRFAGYHFERVHLPAICEAEDDILGRAIGEALWPDRYPVEELRKIEESIGPYGWASLFQQRPRPRGADVFVEPGRFSLRDWRPDGHRIMLCCDPAATDDTRADFSAAFVLAAKGWFDDLQIDILHGWRNQVTVPTVARKLLEISRRYWNAPVAVETVGAFKGVAQILREIAPRLRIREIKPLGDKFTRAQGVAAAWNAGRVRVPLDSEFDWNPTDGRFEIPLDPKTGARAIRRLRAGVPVNVRWAHELIAEALKFTGVGDKEDDQIDAIAHGFNEMYGLRPTDRGAAQNRNPFG